MWIKASTKIINVSDKKKQTERLPLMCIIFITYDSFMILLRFYKSLYQQGCFLFCELHPFRLAQRVAQIPDTLTGDLRLRNAAQAEALGDVELSESRAASGFTARTLCAHRSDQDAQHER